MWRVGLADGICVGALRCLDSWPHEVEWTAYVCHVFRNLFAGLVS